MSTSLESLQQKIERLKAELLALGPMRPGSISRQYRNPGEKKRPFHQISYTHRMKSRSEYVRPENLVALQQETKNFKRFRQLTQRWVDLALKISQIQARQNRPPA